MDSMERATVPRSLGLIAEQNNAIAPHAEAVVDGIRRETWSTLFWRSASMASALTEQLGCAPGDRVAFLGETCLEGFELFHATARAGVLLVPLNERLSTPEISAIIEVTEPRVVFHTRSRASLAHELASRSSVATVEIDHSFSSAYEHLIRSSVPRDVYLPRETSEDWVSSICFTSGTTGKPKGVLMTHAGQMEFARVETEIEPIGPQARHLLARSLGVAAAHRMTAWHGLHAGTTILTQKFSPAIFFETVARERVTNVLLAPTQLRMIASDGNSGKHDLSSLRCIVYGGAPMPDELMRELLALFPPIFVQGYGATEGGQMLYLSAEDHFNGHLRSNGHPVPGAQIALRDDRGATPADGEPGQIYVRSRQLMAGYWRDPERTESVLRDGWFATGDLGVVDADGYFRLVGRTSDMIISGGFNLFPAEVEAVLETHPAVHEAAVFGMPDDLWGETVCAAVVLVAGQRASADDLAAHCRSLLSSFKKPRYIVFLEQMPRTAAGKMDKPLLQSLAGEMR